MRPILCLVIDRAVAHVVVTELVASVAAAGADWIQVRDRTLPDAALLEHAQEVATAARAASSTTRILVNKRVDIALACAADGVHLGYDAVSIEDARRLLPEGAEVGVSAHAADEVRSAREAGASYAHLAPIFEPRSKTATRPALGVAAIEAAVRHGLPVLAQGGIEVSHCGALIRAGAAGIAVTGSILMADDPGAATAHLRAALDAA